MNRCRPDDYPPYPGPRGQALVEAALVLPIIFMVLLAGAEMSLLYGSKSGQDRNTGVVADVAAAGRPWEPVAAEVLPDCDVTVETSPTGLYVARATCWYRPQITSNAWDGLAMVSEANAAPEPTPTPSPAPSPTP